VNVFISFSGPVSHQTATILEWWLPRVLQQIKPFLSSEDIEKGTRWQFELARVLATCEYGVICLTRSNLNAPWINFEAGALSKSVEASHVSPFLLGLKHSEVRASTPLGQFQLTAYDKNDVKKLIATLNKGLGGQALVTEALNEAFEVWWPMLQEKLAPLEIEAEKEENTEPPPVSVTSDETLEEILDLVREQRRLLTPSKGLVPRLYMPSLYEYSFLDPTQTGAVTSLYERVRKLEMLISSPKLDNSIVETMKDLVWELSMDTRELLRPKGQKIPTTDTNTPFTIQDDVLDEDTDTQEHASMSPDLIKE